MYINNLLEALHTIKKYNDDNDDTMRFSQRDLHKEFIKNKKQKKTKTGNNKLSRTKQKEEKQQTTHFFHHGASS